MGYVIRMYHMLEPAQLCGITYVDGFGEIAAGWKFAD